MIREFKTTVLSQNKNQWAFVVCLIFVAALLTSKYLLSLCTIALAALAVFDLHPETHRIRLNPSFRSILHRMKSRPDIAAIALIFVTYLVLGIFSENTTQSWSLVRMKLSFLLWPVIFLALPPFTRKQYLFLFYFLLVNVLLSAMFVLIAYGSDAYIFNRSLGYGHSLPTPMNHIRYSLLISLSLVGGLVLLFEKITWRWKWERILISVGWLFLFAFQHILSVRTGLVLSYLGIVGIILMYRFRSRYRGWALLAILLLGTIPVIAYHTIPAFQRKIGYVLYDIGKFRNGEGGGYADSERLRSWQAGIAIGNKSPWTGTGFGDVKDEIIAYYQTEFQSEKYWKPHNQFIAVFAGGGFIGVALLLFALTFPLIYRDQFRDPLLLIVWMILFLSMMVESTIDNYIGSAIFLIFLMTGLSCQEAKDENDRKR